MTAMGTLALVPAAARELSERTVTPVRLAELLWQFLERDNDYPAVGDAMLAVLFRPGQDRCPDELSELIAENVRRLVAARFGVSDTLTYRLAHHHEHVRHDRRGDWAADVFPSLVVLALALGAYRRNFPPPHAGRLEYYRILAEQQRRDILAAAELARAAPRPRGLGGPSAADREREMAREIEDVRRRGRELRLPTHKVEFEIEYIRQQFAAEAREEARR
jgi:hypothetical protein